MVQENEKNDLRVEDRRHFDKEGNPLRSEEQQDSTTAANADEPQFHKTSKSAPPPIDFTSLIFLYVQTAFIHLGELEDPGERKTMQNLEAARQMIDIIELLQEKTKGNLTTQEDQYLEKVLFDLRMVYVQKAQKP